MVAPKRPSDEVLEFIREHFRYNAETGVLERYHKYHCTWNEVKLIQYHYEKTNQLTNPSICLKYFNNVGHKKERTLQISHICWFLHNKEWPTKEIDHKDKNPCNNKLTNLRLVNSSLQQLNRNFRNRKYLPGVCYHRNRTKPFSARLNANGSSYTLGYYTTEVKAHEAYRAKYKEVHGEDLAFPCLEWHKPVVTEEIVDPFISQSPE